VRGKRERGEKGVLFSEREERMRIKRVGVGIRVA